MNDIRKSSHSLKSKSASSSRVPILRTQEESLEEVRNIKVASVQKNKIRDREVEDYFSTREDFRKKIINNKKQNKFPLTYFIFAIIFILFISLTFIFNSGTIKITQKKVDIEILDTFEINNTLNTESFQVIEIKKELVKDLPKTEKIKKESKSAGSITIYNDYNENSQKLVKNTRFQSADGKVFRISESVTVPPKLNGVKGEITVKVTADSVGADYNIAPGKFTIPGFKGSERYEGFYAVSSSNMSGGSSGDNYLYSGEDIDAADMQIKSEVRDMILSDIPNIKKTGFLAVYNESDISFTNNKDKLLGGVEDKYKVSASFKVYLIKESDLSQKIATKYFPSYKNESVLIKNIESVNVSLIKATSTPDNTLHVKLSGKTMMELMVDQAKLKNEIAGIKIKGDDQSFTNVVSNFTEISSAVPSVSPIWTKKFPSNPNKIEVIIE